jgi:hypothetical protein
MTDMHDIDVYFSYGHGDRERVWPWSAAGLQISEWGREQEVARSRS